MRSFGLVLLFLAACGSETPIAQLPPDGGSSSIDAGRDAGRDAEADASIEPTRGGPCNGGTCASDEVCIPGCRGVCACEPAPDGGSCPFGPCSCGMLGECNAPPPPAHCEKTVPGECQVQPDGTIRCLCA